MSRTIEENIVKMRFDNSDFDKNVESSEKQISKFKAALIALPSATLLGLSNVLRNVSLSDAIGIGAALTGIGLVKAGINGIGETIESVAFKGLSAVTTVFETTMNQIKVGGMQRALNIEQAKFQIEGLKLDVETFMEAADYAVSGTAYSLDAAAKAASQFGASGITELEELKKALRGVSGVAAMTNSSYEEIAHIFTTVAGNGRLMSEQLNSLSIKGLNVAANLGKALGKTEAEIRKMVTDGEIDFRTFANAMDDTFGEHAKDANKTFTGAMSNINAALSRIGEAFATPYIQNMIGFYNELRETINDFKAELQANEVFTNFANAIEVVIKEASRLIDNFNYSIDQTPFMEHLASLSKFIFDSAKDITTSFLPDSSYTTGRILINLGDALYIIERIFTFIKDSFNEVFGILQVGANFQSLIVWIFEFLGKARTKFEEYETDISEAIHSWFVALKEVFDVIKDVLGIDRSTFETLFGDAVTGILEFIKSLTITDEKLDKIRRSAKGFGSVLALVKDIASGIYKTILKPIFSMIPGFNDGILTISSSVGDWLTNTKELLDKHKVVETVFEHISKIVEFITKVLGSAGNSFLDVFFGKDSNKKSFLTKVKEFVLEVKNEIKDIFGSLDWESLDFTPIADFFNELFGIDDTTGETEADAKKYEDKKTFIEKVFDFFGLVFNTIKTFFSSGSGNTTSQIQLSSSSGGIIGILEAVGKLISDSFTSLKDFINGLDLSGAEITGIVLIFKILIDAIKDIILKLIDFAGLVAKYSIAAIATEGVLTSIKNFFDGLNFDALGNFFKKLGNINVDVADIVHGKEKSSELFYSMAWFIAAIAASVAVLSSKKIDAERIESSIKAIRTIIEALFGYLIILRILGGLLPNLGQPLVRSANNVNTGLMNLWNTSGNITKFIQLQSDGIFSDLSEAIEGITGFIFVVAVSLRILDKVSEEDIKKKSILLGAFLGYIGIVIAALVKFTTKSIVAESDVEAYRLLKSEIEAFALSILIIAAAIRVLTHNIDPAEADRATTAALILAGLLGEIAIIIGIWASLASQDAKSLIFSSIAMITACIGMFLMMGAVVPILMAFGEIDSDKLGKVVGTFAALMGIITAAAAVLSLVSLVVGKSQYGIAALLIIDGALLSFALDLLALWPILKSVQGIITSLNKFLNDYVSCLEFFRSLDEGEVQKIIKNMLTLASGFWASAIKAWGDAAMTSIGAIVKIIAGLIVSVNQYLTPIILESVLMIVPQINEVILEAFVSFINTINDFYPELSSALYELLIIDLLPDIMKWGDQIWDDTVAWLKERIPVWIPDVVDLTLLLIQTLNDAMDGNWDLFNEELQELIDDSLDLLTDLLTGEKTWEDISKAIDELLDHCKEVFQSEDTQKKLKEFFTTVGDTVGNAIVDGVKDVFDGRSLKELITDWWNDEGEIEVEDTPGVVNPRTRGTNLNRVDNNDFSVKDLWNDGKGWFKKITDTGTDLDNALDGLLNDTGINDIQSEIDDMYSEIGNLDFGNSKAKAVPVNVTLLGDASKFFEAETKYQNKLIRSGIY